MVFVQHQCVVPSSSQQALSEVLKRVQRSGVPCPLAVLKQFGSGNNNLLSFPIAGYTLALDFPSGPKTMALLAELDAIVNAAAGRIYLTKDACMSPATFRAGYPRWEQFQAVRERFGAQGKFGSGMATRLNL